MERFYFDSQMGTCQKFYFGGCDGRSRIHLSLSNLCFMQSSLEAALFRYGITFFTADAAMLGLYSIVKQAMRIIPAFLMEALLCLVKGTVVRNFQPLVFFS
jgi:hypothetical protein